MTLAVIDTNVLLVANNKHQGVSRGCVLTSVQRLQQMQLGGVVVIDDSWRIIREYQRDTSPNQPKGVGDVFLKWLLRNRVQASAGYRFALSSLRTVCSKALEGVVAGDLLAAGWAWGGGGFFLDGVGEGQGEGVGFVGGGQAAFFHVLFAFQLDFAVHARHGFRGDEVGVEFLVFGEAAAAF